MKSTDNLRRQHRELLRIGSEIGTLIKTERGTLDAVKLRSLIASMAGILNVHLAMEDGVMYPQLLQHQDPHVRALAKRFIDEMGSLRATFGEYVHRWNIPGAMVERSDAFARETSLLLEALVRRIEREDNELYPHVDEPSQLPPPLLSTSPLGGHLPIELRVPSR